MGGMEPVGYREEQRKKAEHLRKQVLEAVLEERKKAEEEALRISRLKPVPSLPCALKDYEASKPNPPSYEVGDIVYSLGDCENLRGKRRKIPEGRKGTVTRAHQRSTIYVDFEAGYSVVKVSKNSVTKNW